MSRSVVTRGFCRIDDVPSVQLLNLEAPAVLGILYTGVPRIRSPTPAEFAAYLDTYPAPLPLWRAGAGSGYRILAALNVLPVQRNREAPEEHGPHLAAMLYHHAHHTQAGIATTWVLG